jgi:hypothetical protein
VKLFQELIGPLLCFRAREAEVQAMEMDVFVDRAGAIEGIELRHNAHVSAGQSRGTDYVDAGDVDRAGGGQNTRRADTDCRRLARAIWAEQTIQLTFADTKFNAIHGDDALFALVDFTKTLHLDN